MAPRSLFHWIIAAWLCCSIGRPSTSAAHDIPNARIDRSTQVILAPERLQVLYEVSLGELTLVQDLRQLDGEEPAQGDRTALFDRYARVVGPLNARGFLIRVDDSEVELRAVGFNVVIEDHLRFRFRFEAKLPPKGTLSVVDTNYASSEGATRLGLRVDPSLDASGDLPPTDVASIASRPTWQLSDLEERRTKRLRVAYVPRASPGVLPTEPPPSPAPASPREATSSGLTRLLDHRSGASTVGWLIAAFFLGMIHAVQPGHGKTLVAAANLGGPGAARRGAILGLITAGCHLVGVVAVASILWSFETNRFGSIHLAVARISGGLVAAVGLFRVGRHLAGIDASEHRHSARSPLRTTSSLWILGLAGGFVPCWDAVALVVLANSIGRLRWGLALLVAFSLGLAAVLVGVGTLAGRIQSRIRFQEIAQGGQRRLGFVSGLVLTAIGLGLLNS